MEQQPGSKEFQERLRPWLRERTTRADLASRLENIESFGPVADQVEWAFATVRYAWDLDANRGPIDDKSRAVRLLVRAGFEIAESAWEAVLDDRPPLLMALSRLIAEMHDKMMASSMDPKAARHYLDDGLEWKAASERIRKRTKKAELEKGPPDWYTAIRESGSDVRWIHGPAHGGNILASRFQGDDSRLFGQWPDYESGYEHAFQAASLTVRWCESAVIALDNVAHGGQNPRRRDRMEAAIWLDGLAYTVARAGLTTFGLRDPGPYPKRRPD